MCHVLLLNSTRVCLHVKCPALLSDFNHIWILWRDLHKRIHYQISRKSVQWEPSWYVWTKGRTDGRDEALGLFSQLCGSA
jgi:hypothetical protein